MKVKGYVQDLWSNKVYPLIGENDKFFITSGGNFRKDKSALVDGHGPLDVDHREIEYKGDGLWDMKDDEETHAPVVSDGEDYTPIRPAHYHEGGIDVFKYAAANFSYDEIMGYHKGSIIKYVSRAGKKDNELQDLRKAETHIKTLIGYLNMEEAE